MRRKICVVTGSRADYGPLKPLLYALNKDKGIKLQLAVTGSHLSRKFGSTYREIENDGFVINDMIDILLRCDTPQGIAISTGKAVSGFSRAYARLRPDMIVVLGDRFEIFGAAAAACICRIPIAHISGGEITEGAMDDTFRHCITKMSNLHFTALEIYRRRIINMGERPETVFNVGEIGLDGIRNTNFISRKDLEGRLKFKFKKRNLLISFHPATASTITPQQQFVNLLRVLDRHKDTGSIFTKANADAGGSAINRMIDKYVAAHKINSVVFTSLGRTTYLSVMRFADAVVGNSSSGLLEAPSLMTGTINIGDRQSGRVKAKSVIDCGPAFDDINRSFNMLYSGYYQRILKSIKNPYEGNQSSARAVKILKRCDLGRILRKRFFDIGRSV